MLELIIVSLIVVAALFVVVWKVVRPVLKHKDADAPCMTCSSPCAHKNAVSAGDLSCSGGMIRSPLRDNIARKGDVRSEPKQQ